MTFSLTREDGHNVPILRPVVPLHDQLMSSRYQRQPVVVVERLGDVLTKRVPSSSRGDPPSASVVGVGPEEIAHGAFVRHLLYAIERSNVIQRVDAGGETSVEAEDLVVDEGGERQIVEEVGEVFPHVRISIFPEALVVEAVDLRDLAGLVVATEDGDALGVSDFERDEQGDGLDRVVASINVVACDEPLTLL
jgi:hypothetical protein